MGLGSNGFYIIYFNKAFFLIIKNTTKLELTTISVVGKINVTNENVLSPPIEKNQLPEFKIYVRVGSSCGDKYDFLNVGIYPKLSIIVAKIIDSRASLLKKYSIEMKIAAQKVIQSLFVIFFSF